MTHQLPGSVYQGYLSHPDCTLGDTKSKYTYLVEFFTHYCIIKYTLDLATFRLDLTLTYYISTRYVNL